MVFFYILTSIYGQKKHTPVLQTYTLNEENSFTMITVPGKNYSIGQTEVTQALYQAVMKDNPSNFGNGENPPVDGINWYDAIVFCNKLSLLLNKTPAYSVNGVTDPDEWGYEPHGATSLPEMAQVDWNTEADGFRLPTEDEWEYAAAAGTDSKYAGENLKDSAWYRKNSDFTPQSVASKAPNKWGLYDMSGNVWEWVWDKYKKDSIYRVYKGGSSSSDKKLCQIKFQGHHYPSRNAMCYSYLLFGFRIARGAK